MIRYFATFDDAGRILGTGSYPYVAPPARDNPEEDAPDEFDPLSHLRPNVVSSDALIDPLRHYVRDGKVEEFPPKPSDWHTWDWTAYAWRENPAKAKEAKAVEIDTACRAAILAGFESSALGAAHHYPAKMTDQQNLASSVLDSTLPGVAEDWVTPFWCADAAGQWDFRKHSAGQIQQVGRQAKAAILAAMNHNESLQRAISAATTIEEVEAIQW